MIRGGRREVHYTRVCVCVLYACMQMCMCLCVCLLYICHVFAFYIYPAPSSIPTVIQGKIRGLVKSGRFKLCTEQNGA